MPLTTLGTENLYSEIADLARDQGIKSKAEWVELVNMTVEDHLEMGEIDLDDDVQGMKEELRARWLEFKASSTEEEDDESEEEASILEDDDDEEVIEEEKMDFDYGDGDEEV